MKNSYTYFLFTILLILLDQIIKLWMHFVVVPQHFGELNIINGFMKLHYVTNRGMAFGLELGGNYGKLILTLFRLLAMVGIGYYLNMVAQNKHTSKVILFSIAAILAGAIGNVIDSIFYGMFLPHNLPSDAPFAIFNGQVIDMFYCNFLDGFWPKWVPIVGGTYHSTPIFNFADACIFCGVVSIMIYTLFDNKTADINDYTSQT